MTVWCLVSDLVSLRILYWLRSVELVELDSALRRSPGSSVELRCSGLCLVDMAEVCKLLDTMLLLLLAVVILGA